MAVAIPAAVFLFAAPARAQLKDCSALGTTSALDQCYGERYKQADAMLNDVYRRLLGKLDPSTQTLLRQAEEAWIAFRDKECAFETAGTNGGSIHTMEVSICLTAQTQAHTAALSKQLNCPEGDTSCTH
ncbi:MAG: DUF1311 domain-containing protein [Alphaproteobacteria bacterium]|nr:DUF1311 domain-containing protein [Alphaproteobacteria bacterium]